METFGDFVRITGNGNLYMASEAQPREVAITVPRWLYTMLW